jgi:Zn-dependent protease with chaperone function
LFLVICLGGAFRGIAAQSQRNAPAIPSESQASAATPNNQVSTDAYRLSPEKYEKAVAYSRAGYRLYFVSVFWDIIVILALLGSGVIRRLRDFAEARSRLLPVQALIFVPALFIVIGLANLPLRIYWHHLSLAFQQSIQPWGSWLWDWTKGEFLTIALAIFVVIALFALIRWKPRSWWLYAWLGAIPLSLFLVFISPWYIDPLFNSFTPLKDSHPQLVQSIGELSRRAGIPIPPERMFLMRASAKTTAINAYATGMGASKRIVIWDTSIQETRPEELLFIVGHEMGHYVLGHVVKGFAWFLGLLLTALYLAYRLLQWIIRRWGNAWGIRAQSDWAALGALLLLFNILSFLGEPIGNAISRRQEHAADVYSLELIQGLFPDANEVAAHAFQVLGEKDLSDPNPSKFITFWLYSHPPLNDRLRFAHDFRPAPQTATPNPPR